MLLRATLLGSLASLGWAQTTAKSYTGWDCCKPVCANGGGNQALLDSRGVARVCDKDNNVQDLNTGLWATSGCSSGGSAYLCADYQPRPVSADLSYGFAYQVSQNQNQDNPNCCKCHEVEWLSGEAKGKKMIVQVLTPGGSGGDVKLNDLIILTPGGGLGPFTTGCSSQYGNSYSWGKNNGGLDDRGGCEGLPPNLQAGCYWRFNWAGGSIIGGDISYKQVDCPSALTDISGCSA